ncbi:MAG TPA: hypothetical protein VKI41_16130 [Vicinamibacteria bacterium]|nr:hypothetical protein [Vicinamibacteria bacterium]
MMRFRLWLCLAVLLALPLSTCSSGGECDTCKVDTDCKGGLVCVNFQDPATGSVVGKRCGSGVGVTSCRVH